MTGPRCTSTRVTGRTGSRVDEDEYQARKTGTGPAPFLVSSITSDGVQCKVTLITLGRGVATGIKELTCAGYDKIVATCDLTEHTRGLFKGIKPLDDDFLDILDRRDPACFVEAVGCDPGVNVLTAHARARVFTGTTPEDHKGSDRFFNSSEYRFLSLAKRAERFERERKLASPAYRDALDSYGTGEASLKTPGRDAAYSQVLYSNLDVMAVEHFSAERRQFRFARLRARDRTLSHVARDLCGGDPVAATTRVCDGDCRRRERQGKPPLTPERKLLIERMRARLAGGRCWSRVIFFGNAQFGSGSRGPIPKKALLKVLGEACCVVLTDEYLTSKTCCACGSRLKQCKGSRVFQCPSRADEDLPCSVTLINRDTTASVNMSMIGVHQLRGQGRPAHLRRPPGPVDEAVAG